jgi:hypothetical protein
VLEERDAAAARGFENRGLHRSSSRRSKRTQSLLHALETRDVVYRRKLAALVEAHATAWTARDRERRSALELDEESARPKRRRYWWRLKCPRGNEAKALIYDDLSELPFSLIDCRVTVDNCHQLLRRLDDRGAALGILCAPRACRRIKPEGCSLFERARLQPRVAAEWQ